MNYEKHIVKCPNCGKDVLDHMTQCPSCKSSLEPQNYKSMDDSRIRKIRMILTIILFAVVAVILIIKYLN